MRRMSYFLFGALMGGMIGGIFALLFAPRKGEETRLLFVQKFNESSQQIRQAVEERRKELEDEIQKSSQ